MKPDLKLYEIQDEYGDVIARYRTFHQAMGGLDVWLKQRNVDREMLENKIREAQDELDNLKEEVLEIVEVEATEQRLTYMKNWENTGLSLFEHNMEYLAVTNAEESSTS